MFYCECAAGFCNDVGYQDDSYFHALVRMFEQVLKIIGQLSASDRNPLIARLDKVRTHVEASVAQMTAISRDRHPANAARGNTALDSALQRFHCSDTPGGAGREGLSEQALYDLGTNFLRTQLATVQRASVLMPAGGKARQVMVDLDPSARYTRAGFRRPTWPGAGSGALARGALLSALAATRSTSA